MVDPMIEDLEDGYFIRCIYVDRETGRETFHDITTAQWTVGEYDDQCEVELHFMYDPIREHWVRVEDTKGWYGLMDRVDDEERIRAAAVCGGGSLLMFDPFVAMFALSVVVLLYLLTSILVRP